MNARVVVTTLAQLVNSKQNYLKNLMPATPKQCNSKDVNNLTWQGVNTIQDYYKKEKLESF